MLIRAKYRTANVPVTYETDNDGEPVYSITITDWNAESVNDLGCLMVLLNNTLREAHHFHKVLEQQTNRNIHRNRHILHLEGGIDWIFTGRNWLFNRHKKTYDYLSVDDFHENFYNWHC